MSPGTLSICAGTIVTVRVMQVPEVKCSSLKSLSQHPALFPEPDIDTVGEEVGGGLYF